MDSLGRSFHLAKPCFQMSLQGLKAVENAIMKLLFPKLITEMFDRIDFQGIGGRVKSLMLSGIIKF